MKITAKVAALELNVSRIFKLAVIAALLLVSVLPGRAFAAAGTLTARKLTLGSSAISGSTTHKFDFTLNGTDNLGSIKFEYCVAATGACGTVTGLNVDGVTLDAQTGATGFTVDATTTTATVIGITRTAASASGALSYTFGAAVNPSTVNSTFYVRITTYTANNFSSSDDTGTVAASTAEQITVTATVDESLTFCTGTSGITTSSCTGATGSSVGLGTLSASATNSGVSQIGVGTNALSGYVITINGNTLTCTACSGSPTISAMTGASNTSTIGTEEFGVNLRDNATPNVGVEPDGAGSATPTDPYDDTDEFFFQSGDTIASKSSSDNFRRFHVAYIANIDTATEAGAYTTTLTYIATATF
jgi:hypothetical protein